MAAAKILISSDDPDGRFPEVIDDLNRFLRGGLAV
jgi:hypothetical protein